MINLKPEGTQELRIRTDFLVPLIFAAIKFLIHAYVNMNGGYGYFRDELYYIACTENVDIGYVDHPPLSIWILSVSRVILGDSIFSLRLLPALVGSATVLVVGAMARRLGGGRIAQAFSCLAATLSLVWLGMNTTYSMNSFDILFCSFAAYAVILIVQTGNWKYWIILGVVLGLGLLNKLGMVWFAGGIYIGFLMNKERRWFVTPWPLTAATIAGLIFLPYIIWNVRHDFAHMEFITNALKMKYASQTPLTFATGQLLLQNPVTLPLWLAGLVYLLFSKVGSRYRAIGIAYVVAFLVLILNSHSKAEYLAPAYGGLFAAGGVAIESFMETRRMKWLGVSYYVILISGFILAPLVTPILSVEDYIQYAHSLGVKPSTAEAKELDELPQFYADMFGWKEKAEEVAVVFSQLPEDEQQRCGIYADNYGRCAAIDFFGKKFGLPRAISGHNSYWMWGPRNYTGDVMIILGGKEKDHRKVFEEVTFESFVKCEYCMPYESRLNIYICRKPKVQLPEFWRKIKKYI